MALPNVFVIPPEEDNELPFCCFDAADPLERYIPTEEDLEGPGSALEMIFQPSNHDSPVFRRGSQPNGVVMPRKSGRPIAEILTSEEDYDPDVIVRDSVPPGNDSEIIEVIKVRRHIQDEHDIPPSSTSKPTFKPSKSFRSRASRAFSSIKNAGRSVSRSRMLPNDRSSNGSSSRAPSPTPSRRGSMIFSSLFSHQPSLEPRSSFDSFNEPPPLEASSSAPLGQLHSPSSAEMHDFVPYSDTDDEDGEEDIQATPRASRRPPSLRSPSPSSVSQLGRRRFSVLNLFSASKDSEISDTGPSTVITSPSIPTLPSRDSLGPSRTDSTESSVSSGPATPVDDVFPDPLPHRPSVSLLKRLPSFSRSPRKSKADVSVAPIDDLSFGEIRLDSLHFDELSFDASRF